MKDLEEMCHENKFQLIPKDKINELNTRKSVVNYLEYVAEHEHGLKVESSLEKLKKRKR